jgi:RNA polymerase sigma-70 factor (ECF subfamily)
MGLNAMSASVVNGDPEIEASELPESACAGNSRENEVSCMKRMASGDASAMREVVVLHGKMLTEFVGRLTAWHADHEDILQQVLVAAWENAGSFRGDGPLEGWLKRIAVHRSRNHYRMVARLRRKLEAWAGDRPQPNQEKSIEMLEVNEELQHALGQLNPDDRTAVVLFYLEQQSGEQVADWMRISLPAFHTRLSRARKRLKALMPVEYFDEK